MISKTKKFPSEVFMLGIWFMVLFFAFNVKANEKRTAFDSFQAQINESRKEAVVVEPEVNKALEEAFNPVPKEVEESKVDVDTITKENSEKAQGIISGMDVLDEYKYAKKGKLLSLVLFNGKGKAFKKLFRGIVRDGIGEEQERAVKYFVNSSPIPFVKVTAVDFNEIPSLKYEGELEKYRKKIKEVESRFITSYHYLPQKEKVEFQKQVKKVKKPAPRTFPRIEGFELEISAGMIASVKNKDQLAANIYREFAALNPMVYTLGQTAKFERHREGIALFNQILSDKEGALAKEGRNLKSQMLNDFAAMEMLLKANFNPRAMHDYVQDTILPLNEIFLQSKNHYLSRSLSKHKDLIQSEFAHIAIRTSGHKAFMKFLMESKYSKDIVSKNSNFKLGMKWNRFKLKTYTVPFYAGLGTQTTTLGVASGGSYTLYTYSEVALNALSSVGASAVQGLSQIKATAALEIGELVNKTGAVTTKMLDTVLFETGISEAGRSFFANYQLGLAAGAASIAAVVLYKFSPQFAEKLKLGYHVIFREKSEIKNINEIPLESYRPSENTSEKKPKVKVTINNETQQIENSSKTKIVESKTKNSMNYRWAKMGQSIFKHTGQAVDYLVQIPVAAVGTCCKAYAFGIRQMEKGAQWAGNATTQVIEGSKAAKKSTVLVTKQTTHNTVNSLREMKTNSRKKLKAARESTVLVTRETVQNTVDSLGAMKELGKKGVVAGYQLAIYKANELQKGTQNRLMMTRAQLQRQDEKLRQFSKNSAIAVSTWAADTYRATPGYLEEVGNNLSNKSKAAKLVVKEQSEKTIIAVGKGSYFLFLDVPFIATEKSVELGISGAYKAMDTYRASLNGGKRAYRGIINGTIETYKLGNRYFEDVKEDRVARRNIRAKEKDESKKHKKEFITQPLEFMNQQKETRVKDLMNIDLTQPGIFAKKISELIGMPEQLSEDIGKVDKKIFDKRKKVIADLESQRATIFNHWLSQVINNSKVRENFSLREVLNQLSLEDHKDQITNKESNSKLYIIHRLKEKDRGLSKNQFHLEKRLDSMLTKGFILIEEKNLIKQYNEVSKERSPEAMRNFAYNAALFWWSADRYYPTKDPYLNVLEGYEVRRVVRIGTLYAIAALPELEQELLEAAKVFNEKYDNLDKKKLGELRINQKIVSLLNLDQKIRLFIKLDRRSTLTKYLGPVVEKKAELLLNNSETLSGLNQKIEESAKRYNYSKQVFRNSLLFTILDRPSMLENYEDVVRLFSNSHFWPDNVSEINSTAIERPLEELLEQKRKNPNTANVWQYDPIFNERVHLEVVNRLEDLNEMPKESDIEGRINLWKLLTSKGVSALSDTMLSDIMRIATSAQIADLEKYATTEGRVFDTSLQDKFALKTVMRSRSYQDLIQSSFLENYAENESKTGPAGMRFSDERLKSLIEKGDAPDSKRSQLIYDFVKTAQTTFSSMGSAYLDLLEETSKKIGSSQEEAQFIEKMKYHHLVNYDGQSVNAEAEDRTKNIFHSILPFIKEWSGENQVKFLLYLRGSINEVEFPFITKQFPKYGPERVRMMFQELEVNTATKLVEMYLSQSKILRKGIDRSYAKSLINEVIDRVGDEKTQKYTKQMIQSLMRALDQAGDKIFQASVLAAIIAMKPDKAGSVGETIRVILESFPGVGPKIAQFLVTTNLPLDIKMALRKAQDGSLPPTALEMYQDAAEMFGKERVPFNIIRSLGYGSMKYTYEAYDFASKQNLVVQVFRENVKHSTDLYIKVLRNTVKELVSLDKKEWSYLGVIVEGAIAAVNQEKRILSEPRKNSIARNYLYKDASTRDWHIEVPFQKYAGGRILMSDKANGVSFFDLNEEQKVEAAKFILELENRIFMGGAEKDGDPKLAHQKIRFDADRHAGNYLIQMNKNGRNNLFPIDFGQLSFIKRSQRHKVVQLMGLAVISDFMGSNPGVVDRISEMFNLDKSDKKALEKNLSIIFPVEIDFDRKRNPTLAYFRLLSAINESLKNTKHPDIAKGKLNVIYTNFIRGLVQLNQYRADVALPKDSLSPIASMENLVKNYLVGLDKERFETNLKQDLLVKSYNWKSRIESWVTDKNYSKFSLDMTREQLDQLSLFNTEEMEEIRKTINQVTKEKVADFSQNEILSIRPNSQKEARSQKALVGVRCNTVMK